MRYAKPDPDDLGDALFRFGDLLLSAFSYAFYLLEFRKHPLRRTDPDFDFRSLYIIEALRISSLASTYRALRDLDDFLAPPIDDMPGMPASDAALKAHHLAFPRTAHFLTHAERRAIDTAAVENSFWPPREEEKPRLDTRELSAKAASQGLDFLVWIRDTFPPEDYRRAHAAALFYILHLRDLTRHLHIPARRPPAAHPPSGT